MSHSRRNHRRDNVANINEARELWIETAYEAGDDIPLPSTDDSYSGKLLLRMPKSSTSSFG